MLEIHEKRQITRIIGPNQAVKMKASAFEIIQNPVGVAAVNVLEAQTTMIKFLSNKVNALEELLVQIKEATCGSEKS